MTKRILPVLCMLALLGVSPRTARADQAPTIFDNAYQGLLVGGLAGTATGYFFARQDGWTSGDWKPLVYGAGIGAIAGSTIGLTLGIVDMAQDKPHRHGYVMRDGLLGAGFGAVVGGLIGGLTAISTKKGEHILLGGSIGVLSGTVLGMTLGIIEGQKKSRVAIVPVAQAGGAVAFLPGVVGNF